MTTSDPPPSAQTAVSDYLFSLCLSTSIHVSLSQTLELPIELPCLHRGNAAATQTRGEILHFQPSWPRGSSDKTSNDSS